MSATAYPAIDVFQASLLNIVQEASDIGIDHFFETKKNELNRFLICQYIRSLRPTHPLRSKKQHFPLSSSKSLAFSENDSAAETKLKNEWSALLNHSRHSTEVQSQSLALQTKRFDGPPAPKMTNVEMPLKFEFAQPSSYSSTHSSPAKRARLAPVSNNYNLEMTSPTKQTAQSIDVEDGRSISVKSEAAEDIDTEAPFNYRSISRSCWIYIVQEFCLQKDKLGSLPFLNHFFNDLCSDRLVWRELTLSAFQINCSIRHHHYAAFELFLSRSCTNLQTLDFECLAKDKVSWNTIWALLSKHCLTLKHIHIGLYDGIWKFEYNQLQPICEDLFRNVQRHVVPNPSVKSGSDKEENDDDADVDVEINGHGDGNNEDVDPDIALRESANYLPITRIECAPGVMPTHIVSLLRRARVLEHFFVPLIYNDGDDRWDSNAFWKIPHTLPSTLKSFRGFDAQTPLRFVHECISNLPNIEEFHVVLYFGSAHPDFIACSMTSATLSHLAANCRRLRSFEGYFHSTANILEGVEAMVTACRDLQLIGLLFHPEVPDEDIDSLIASIGDSKLIYQPQFSRLTENPNQHVQLRVVEIGFNPRKQKQLRLRAKRLKKQKQLMMNREAKRPSHHRNGHGHGGSMNSSPMANLNLQTSASPPNLGPYAGISSKHIKSLDEIDSHDEAELEEEQEVFDGHAGIELSHNGNSNSKRNGESDNRNSHRRDAEQTVTVDDSYAMSQSDSEPFAPMGLQETSTEERVDDRDVRDRSASKQRQFERE